MAAPFRDLDEFRAGAEARQRCDAALTAHERPNPEDLQEVCHGFVADARLLDGDLLIGGLDAVTAARDVTAIETVFVNILAQLKQLEETCGPGAHDRAECVRSRIVTGLRGAGDDPRILRLRALLLADDLLEGRSTPDPSVPVSPWSRWALRCVLADGSSREFPCWNGLDSGACELAVSAAFAEHREFQLASAVEQRTGQGSGMPSRRAAARLIRRLWQGSSTRWHPRMEN